MAHKNTYVRVRSTGRPGILIATRARKPTVQLGPDGPNEKIAWKDLVDITEEEFDRLTGNCGD